jgi:hypothetical protein
MGRVNANIGPCVFLGMDVYWLGAPSGGSVNIGPRALTRSPLTDGNLGASGNSDNRRTVTDTAPGLRQFGFNGSVPRTVGSEETLAINYTSNADAGGGEIVVVFTTLRSA